MNDETSTRLWYFLIIILFLPLGWIYIHLTGIELNILFEALLPGIAIFSAAFMLSWAAELAMMEIPGALAFAILAVVAVLPEYAVDIYFAWEAARRPEYISYAAANMTGANRLLIGLGWPVIVFTVYLKTKKKEIVLAEQDKLLVVTLLVATLYSFFIPVKGTLSFIDAIVFLLIFGVYIQRATKQHVVEPELEGIPELIGGINTVMRRIITAFFFIYAGFTIYISAEPFAEGLLKVGRHFNIEEFILVQWLAPIASESPEFIVAVIFALKANPKGGFETLLSSKINQWTLLVGMLPLAFIISLGAVSPMHLDCRQRDEILLTSAQSLFAVFILSNLRFSMIEAILLFILFFTQLMVFTSSTARFIYSFVYIIFCFAFVVFSRDLRRSLLELFTLKK